MTALSNILPRETSIISPLYKFFESDFEIPASTTLSQEKFLTDEALDAIIKIKSYQRLENNWDSYGGIAPTKEIIEQAKDFVIKMDSYGCKIFFSAPGPNGEILVELKKDNRSVEVVFNDNKNVEVAFFENENCIEEINFLDENKIVAWLL